MSMQRSLGTPANESDAFETRPVQPAQWAEFVGWIDPFRDPAQTGKATAELQRRMSAQAAAPPPLETVHKDRRVAGAYVLNMGAKVASVGGVRSVENHSPSAAALLGELVQRVRELGAVQIQAVVDGEDSAVTTILERAGFVPLADLQQLWLPLTADSEAASRAGGDPPHGAVWRPADDVPAEEVATLLGQTFVETLDCPALNGLRTSQDILAGFCDGTPLEQHSGWWFLEKEGRLMGCVLTNPLADHGATASSAELRAAELLYLGLVPGARGRGYGRFLLERSIATARQLGCAVVFSAVDCANWPAMRMYAQRGFQERARVQAWFHRLK
jgi:mycothiol synthase